MIQIFLSYAFIPWWLYLGEVIYFFTRNCYHVWSVETFSLLCDQKKPTQKYLTNLDSVYLHSHGSYNKNQCSVSCLSPFCGIISDVLVTSHESHLGYKMSDMNSWASINFLVCGGGIKLLCCTGSHTFAGIALYFIQTHGLKFHEPDALKKPGHTHTRRKKITLWEKAHFIQSLDNKREELYI